MESKTSFILCFALIIVLSSTAKAAVDIDTILGEHAEFSTMKDLLKKTHIDDRINEHQSITVLALDNGVIAEIAGKPEDELMRILNVHVLLDYFDDQKLKEIQPSAKIQTTCMFQATGEAVNNQGFVDIGYATNGKLAFGSGVEGSGLNSQYLKQITAQPNEISVLQISKPIIPAGIEVAPKPQKSL